jgi:hypothetical protein
MMDTNMIQCHKIKKQDKKLSYKARTWKFLTEGNKQKEDFYLLGYNGV